jgi:hypothetical protein
VCKDVCLYVHTNMHAVGKLIFSSNKIHYGNVNQDARRSRDASLSNENFECKMFEEESAISERQSPK